MTAFPALRQKWWCRALSSARARGMQISERHFVADVLSRERLMPMKAIGALLGVEAWQAWALA